MSVFFVMMLVCYIASSLGYHGYVLFQKRPIYRVARILLWVGFLCHTGVVTLQYFEARHVPFQNLQESLSTSEPIYMEQEEFELEINDALLLKGCVLDNDQYIVEDEVHSYEYQEAYDGQTVHQLNVVSPFGDDNFLSKEEFAIDYSEFA